MTLSPERRRLRAQLAARSRHTPDDPELDDVRRELTTERLADELARVADELAPAQRARLVRVLQPEAAA